MAPAGAAEIEIAQADGLSIPQAMERVRTLRQEQRFEDAIPYQKRALMMAQRRFEPRDRRIGLFAANLGSLYMSVGRPDEAEPYLIQALEHREKYIGPDDRSLVGPLNWLTGIQMRKSRFAEAENYARRALDILEANSGANSVQITGALVRLAGISRAVNKFDEAERHYRRALEIRERELGPDRPEVANILEGLGILWRAKGDFKQGEEYSKRAYDIRLAKLGPGDPAVAESLYGLGRSYLPRGRFDEAEKAFEAALAIQEKALGPDDPAVAETLSILARVDTTRVRYAQAEARLKRALTIREKSFGVEHVNTAEAILGLARLYGVQARFGEAEPLFKRARQSYERTFGPDHPRISEVIDGLATVYRSQGRYGEAEPLFKRSMAIIEQSFGFEHPRAAGALANLASLYRLQGRLDDAVPLFRRAIAVREEKLGPDHPSVGIMLAGLAGICAQQQKFVECLPVATRAVDLTEKSLGAEHPKLADALETLAQVQSALGRNDEANRVTLRALAIREKTQKEGHPLMSRALNRVALNYEKEGKFDAAESYYNRAAAAAELLDPTHPLRAQTYANLARVYTEQNRWPEALDASRKATALMRARLEAPTVDPTGEFSEGAEAEQASRRNMFIYHVAALKRGREPKYAHEAFEIGQLAQSSGAARAVSSMAARFAGGTDALAGVVRARQDAVERWRNLDRLLLDDASKPSGERNLDAEAALRAELGALQTHLKGLDEKLRSDFPEFAELTNPRPSTVNEVQEVLAADEALVFYLSGRSSTFLFVVRKDRYDFLRIADVGYETLTSTVAQLRKGLSPDGLESLSDIPPFDSTLAFRAYEKLFAPAEEIIGDARHVIVVPDGALQSLPLGVLVTERPAVPPADFAGYRDVKWLARKYALSVLPSVSSLKALRRFASAAHAEKPFAGFGDPALEGSAGETRGIVTLASRASIADVKAVRNLPPLPDTADELRAIAKSLGASPESIHLRDQATEMRVKSADLSAYRVLAFATHGLLAGDLQGADEPSLVLTPPERGTEEDDGLLTMSEVARLKLNADWVVLSACNTAAPDGSPGAEGLSGLARAFFYAGSRALMVSHWPVASAAAVRLTTGTFDGLRRDPGLGRAEAFRRAQIVLIEDTDAPYLSHPLFWAPFVVVGEGAAR
jgi:CHAT domain-containing protein/Flp pilus assembly protein TadD